MPGMLDENDYFLDEFMAIAEEPAMLSGTAEDGKTTQFYYFWNEHYVCLLSVDTEYMENYNHYANQLKNLCISLGQSINE